MSRSRVKGSQRAHQTAFDQRVQIEALFEGSVSCLVLLDRQFNFVRVNRAYAAVCNRLIEDFAGRNHFELYPSDAKSIFDEVVRSRQAFKASAHPFVFPDDHERKTTYWDWTLTPVLDRRGEVEFLIFSLNDVTERKRTEERLRESEAQLRNLAAALQALRESERAHIARELHDGLGQALTVLKLGVTRAASDLRGGPLASTVGDQLRAIAVGIDHAADSVRELATWLRPAMLDQFGLIPALEAAATALEERSAVRCRVRGGPATCGLSPNQETAIFRIVQEALTNVTRHARASVVVVSVRRLENLAVTSGLDNGTGIDPAAINRRNSLGLAGMRERAELAGGTLEIRPRRRGTAIVVRIPICGNEPTSAS